MATVDDLFSGDAPPPPVPDRTRRIWVILSIATPLNLLGVFCFTGVPGAILSLVAWVLADEEFQRLESGALPAERKGSVERARTAAFTTMVVAGVSLMLQIALFYAGFYDAVLAFLLGRAALIPI